MGATAGVRGCRHQAAATCLLAMAVLLCCCCNALGATDRSRLGLLRGSSQGAQLRARDNNPQAPELQQQPSSSPTAGTVADVGSSPRYGTTREWPPGLAGFGASDDHVVAQVAPWRSVDAAVQRYQQSADALERSNPYGSSAAVQPLFDFRSAAAAMPARASPGAATAFEEAPPGPAASADGGPLSALVQQLSSLWRELNPQPQSAQYGHAGGTPADDAAGDAAAAAGPGALGLPGMPWAAGDQLGSDHAVPQQYRVDDVQDPDPALSGGVFDAGVRAHGSAALPRPATAGGSLVHGARGDDGWELFDDPFSPVSTWGQLEAAVPVDRGDQHRQEQVAAAAAAIAAAEAAAAAAAAAAGSPVVGAAGHQGGQEEWQAGPGGLLVSLVMQEEREGGGVVVDLVVRAMDEAEAGRAAQRPAGQWVSSNLAEDGEEGELVGFAAAVTLAAELSDSLGSMGVVGGGDDGEGVARLQQQQQELLGGGMEEQLDVLLQGWQAAAEEIAAEAGAAAVQAGEGQEGYGAVLDDEYDITYRMYVEEYLEEYGMDDSSYLEEEYGSSYLPEDADGDEEVEGFEEEMPCGGSMGAMDDEAAAAGEEAWEQYGEAEAEAALFFGAEPYSDDAALYDDAFGGGPRFEADGAGPYGGEAPVVWIKQLRVEQQQEDGEAQEAEAEGVQQQGGQQEGEWSDHEASGWGEAKAHPIRPSRLLLGDIKGPVPKGPKPLPEPKPLPAPKPANVWVPGIVRVKVDEDGDTTVKVGPLGSLLTVNAEGPRPGGPGPGPLPGPLPLPGPGPNPAAAVGGAFGGAFGAAVAGPVGGVAGTAIGQAVGGAVGGALATDGPQLGGGGLGGDWGPVVRSNGVHEGTAVDLGDFGELAGLGGSGGAGDRPAVAAATAATAATAAATASGLVEAIPPGAGTTSPFLLQQSAQEQQQGNAAVPAGATHGLRSGGGDNISLDLPGAVPLPGTAAILDTNRQQQLIRHNEQQAGPELPVPAGVPKAEEPKRNVAVSVGPGGSLFRSRSTATGRTDVDVLGGLAVGVSSSELTGRTVTTVGPAGSIARVVATDK